VVFNGWATGSGPGSACVGAFVGPSPASGPAAGGTQVALPGFGFDNVSALSFQNTAVTILSKTDGTMVLRTPPFTCGSQPSAPVSINYQLATGGPFVNLRDPASTFTYTCP
jgi:hypothetical protein